MNTQKPTNSSLNETQSVSSAPLVAAPSVPPTPPTAPAEFNPIAAARALLPAHIRERRRRSDAFISKLTTDQRRQLIQWFLHLPVLQVVARIAAPPPQGFGIEVSEPTVRRAKNLYCSGAQREAVFEALDVAHDLFEHRDPVAFPPMREALAAMLYARAVNQLQQGEPIEEVNKTLTGLSRVERLPRPQPGTPRAPGSSATRHHIELSVVPPRATDISASKVPEDTPPINRPQFNSLDPT